MKTDQDIALKICNELTIKYDSRVLNKYPKRLQNIFFEVAKVGQINKKADTNTEQKQVLVVCSGSDDKKSEYYIDSGNKEIIIELMGNNTNTIHINRGLKMNVYPTDIVNSSYKYTKFDMILFAGCNILEWLFKTKDSITITESFLKDTGIIIFTEGPNYGILNTKIGKSLLPINQRNLTHDIKMMKTFLYDDTSSIFNQWDDIFYIDPDNLKYYIYKKKSSSQINKNSTLISLVNNLKYPTNQQVDYINGPTHLSKWESSKYNKTIYLLGENDHRNIYGCKNNINLQDKKHIDITDYLLNLFKNSPMFIDFYVEWPILFGDIDTFTMGPNQNLHDMFYSMKGCVTNLKNRNCPYNVRMHTIDARNIKGQNDYKKKNYNSILSKMAEDIRTHIELNHISFDNFKLLYKKEIKLLSSITSYASVVKIISNEITSNNLLTKELNKSTLQSKIIINCLIKFYKNKLKEEFPRIVFIGKWFKYAEKVSTYPDGLIHISKFMTRMTAIIMDIYTISRMFKIFDVKKHEHYPLEAFNIIFYGGNGHTEPLEYFLSFLKFKKVESEYSNLVSCIDMTKIKQPLFL
jgi:hypothetical protein